MQAKSIFNLFRIVGVAVLTLNFALCTLNSLAQTPGEWTWMHGDNTPSSPGVFGIQGVANPANKPPAIYEPCEWKDNNGNFWLFGGSTVSAGDRYNALWKYDTGTNQWTWLKGPSAINQPGVYGTQGVPSPANYPGARGYGVTTWVDASGNLWLFGGNGYDAFGVPDILNDLWKYDISTNEWTWMKGPNTGNNPGSYGTQGVSNPANLPPSRGETSCSWTDNAGNLWLYGGQGASIFLGDLWKYDISTNDWTWIHGANTVNPPPVYGTQGVAAPANTPGGRLVYCSWTDLAGNLWLFGGMTPSGVINDLWKYDIAINQWTWMQGANTVNDPGNYGTKCVSANSNAPPARFENRSRVRDACGNFWNFGGFFSAAGILNDLWHYDVSNSQWTWVSGDNIFNQAAVYGVLGVSNPANKPGAKLGSVAWIDNNGYIWVFGGFDMSNESNDLFRYVPDTNCIPCTVSVSLSATVTPVNVLCNGQCNGTSTATPSNGTAPYTYLWNTIPAQTTANSTGLCAGNYTVTVTDAIGGTAAATVTITQPPVLTATVISTSAACGSNNGSATVNPSGGTPGYIYSWTGGQTTQTATGLSVGNYTATVTDVNGCTQTQTVTITSNNTLSVTASSTQTGCTINNGTATANPSNGTAPYTYLWSNGQSTQTATGLAAGTYTVTVTDASGCTQTQTVSVTTITGPAAAATATPASIALGASTTLTASGGGTYLWSPSTGLSCTICANPTATPTQTTTYCVLVTDTASGCTNTACVTVTVKIELIDCSTLSSTEDFFIPNAFSPNGDNENDVLKLYYGNYGCIKTYKFAVYNRWGEKVFESENPNDEWDGSYKGKMEGAAVFAYYMMATLTNGEKINKKGNISLVK